MTAIIRSKRMLICKRHSIKLSLRIEIITTQMRKSLKLLKTSRMNKVVSYAKFIIWNNYFLTDTEYERIVNKWCQRVVYKYATVELAKEACSREQECEMFYDNYGYGKKFILCKVLSRHQLVILFYLIIVLSLRPLISSIVLRIVWFLHKKSFDLC